MRSASRGSACTLDCSGSTCDALRIGKPSCGSPLAFGSEYSRRLFSSARQKASAPSVELNWCDFPLGAFKHLFYSFRRTKFQSFRRFDGKHFPIHYVRGTLKGVQIESFDMNFIKCILKINLFATLKYFEIEKNFSSYSKRKWHIPSLRS